MTVYIYFTYTVKLANSASLFQFRQVKFLRMIKCIFTIELKNKEKLLVKNTFTFYHSQVQLFEKI